MKIYSNTILSWPQTIHAFQAARLYPGRWQNYYFYRINERQPLILTTYSPIELLQENSKYYCYDKYSRDKRLEDYGNSFEIVSTANMKSKISRETWVHIPKMSEPNDILVIRNTDITGHPSIHYPIWSLLPALQ